ncbi:MAG: HAD family phosphatase [Verrucomicrobiaceae bacterium]|jgi:HAD superfamily hydrolase (TIGR01484 family)|nr:MAG: HAD family phosphatase [Verrucomicrobiaceae bacterium]
MNTLPPTPIPTRILSFDFDGTLHDPASDPPVPTEFFRLIGKLREKHGALWGINTGRSLEHLAEAFIESRFSFLPDWVVAREREIYFPDTHGRWLPHTSWNLRCENEVHGLFKRARKLLGRIRHEIEEHTGAQWMEWEGEPAGVISRTEEEMEWIVERVTPIAAEEPHLAWQRNSIYLRFGHKDFHKGSSLAEIARHHRLPAARCFAMGDSHNDLEMLDPTHAGMTACPSNSVAEIREKVISTGGLVTRGAHGHGAIEALRHFFQMGEA